MLGSALNATGYFLSSNTHAVVVDSVGGESRVEFYTGEAGRGDVANALPDVAFAASNATLTTYSGSNVTSRTLYAGTAPFFEVPAGTVQTATVRANARLEVAAATGTRKAVVLRDYNAPSEHQFAGFGFADGAVVHQLPTDVAAHRFTAAYDAATSLELMRITRHPTTHQTQVVIGDGLSGTALAANSNTALHVGGDTVIDGNLKVQGDIDFVALQNVVHYDPVTSLIPSLYLPSNLVSLNASNQVDVSVLPQSYNFQYMRTGKNVGIGTRAPAQKLHVEGTTVVRPRLGVGTLAPAATLHVRQPTAVSPAVLIESDVAAAPLRINVAGAPYFNISSTGGVGIGTTAAAPGAKLHVAGDMRVDGNFIFTSLSITDLEWKDATTQVAYLKNENVAVSGASTEQSLVCRAPFVCTDRISTPTLLATGESNVHFQGCGAALDGDVHVNGDLRVDGAAVFQTQPVVVSDARVKTDVAPLTNALERLLKIRGCSYKKNGVAEVGLIAQEVAEVLPEAVKEVDGTLAVAYDAVIALLVEALREMAG
jgi:hypothetical protein